MALTKPGMKVVNSTPRSVCTCGSKNISVCNTCTSGTIGYIDGIAAEAADPQCCQPGMLDMKGSLPVHMSHERDARVMCTYVAPSVLPLSAGMPT